MIVSSVSVSVFLIIQLCSHPYSLSPYVTVTWWLLCWRAVGNVDELQGRPQDLWGERMGSTYTGSKDGSCMWCGTMVPKGSAGASGALPAVPSGNMFDGGLVLVSGQLPSVNYIQLHAAVLCWPCLWDGCSCRIPWSTWCLIWRTSFLTRFGPRLSRWPMRFIPPIQTPRRCIWRIVRLLDWSSWNLSSNCLSERAWLHKFIAWMAKQFFGLDGAVWDDQTRPHSGTLHTSHSQRLTHSIIH